MPLPPPNRPSKQPSLVMLESPRDAAKRAIVYRRGKRDKRRDSLLRIAGWVGTILLHLVFMFGAIIGSDYDEGQLPPPKGTVLQLRLIDNKPVPPPPPPPLGALPKQHGPRHHGSAAHAPVNHVEPSTAPAEAVVADQPKSMPTPPTVQPPVVAQTPTPAAPKKQRAAAPRPPVSVPKPAPTHDLQPVPVSMSPPAVSLQAPKVPQPVPPKFQPEPVRKAQAEGTQAMPPPASLAMPEVPAQSAPVETPPHIVIEAAVPQQGAATVIASFAKVERPAAPPAPDMQPVPLPAQKAPEVNLQPSPSTAVVSVPHEAPTIEAPAVTVAEAELAPVPLSSKDTLAQEDKPAAPTVHVNTSNAALSPAAIRPELSVTAAPNSASSEAKSAASSSATAPSAEAQSKAVSSESASADKSAAANDNAAADKGNDVSTAPNASPQGSDNAKPGQPNGSAASSADNGKTGGAPSLTQGQGAVPNGTGQGSGTPGTPEGTYIQLKPRGDTNILSNNNPQSRYHPTVFEKYWTPKGESSVDTALRHAVEKTTVGHTFNLPRGVRLKCEVRPLLPIALLGCGGADPPPAPVSAAEYKRLNMPTTNTSVPTVSAPASSQSAPRPGVPLDNSVQCAEARVAGGPIPPDCADATPAKPLNLTVPAHASSGSWVPASDQFH